MPRHLYINKLSIFSSLEKKACHFDFGKSVNIVTSSKVDGNKRGKSVILKSLYHVLGAECYFEDMFNVNSKIFILEVEIDKKIYIFYRHDKLFKVFDNDRQLLFSTVSRSSLSEYISKIFDFAIKLPNRQTNVLEITPPAYTYILNYLDQEGIDGTNFSSFKGLGQYDRYKVNTIYGQLGILNDEYHNLESKLDELNKDQKRILEDRAISEKMIEKLSSELNGYNYNKDLISLNNELDTIRIEYNRVLVKINKTKNKMIELRNKKSELTQSIDELKSVLGFLKDNQSEQISENICPRCGSAISEDSLSAKIRHYNSQEDILILINKNHSSILTLEKDICKQQETYQERLALLEKFDNTLHLNTKTVKDISKQNALVALRDKVQSEIYSQNALLEEIDKSIKELQKLYVKFNKDKKRVDEKYYELMLNDLNALGIQEIDNKSVESIRNSFEGGGSNKSISTIIWYMNLLELKYRFNRDAIVFPIVLDSPNNVEADEEKRHSLFSYIFDRDFRGGQLIVSTLGFNMDEFDNLNESSVNIIELKNEKYCLLNEECYTNHEDLLVYLTSQTSESSIEIETNHEDI